MGVNTTLNVKKGDKVVAKKQLTVFKRVFAEVGDEFEVKDVFYNSVHLKDGNTILTIDSQTFEEHFEKYVEKNVKNVMKECDDFLSGNAKDDLFKKLVEAMKAAENNVNNAIAEESDPEESEVDVIYSTGDHLPNRVTQEMVDEIIEGSEVVVDTMFDRMTVVSCKLPNGFIITETSACIDPENYNEDMGVDICMDKIISKVYELEAYRLMSEIYYSKQLDTWLNCNNMDECDGCPYIDECFGSDEDECEE